MQPNHSAQPLQPSISRGPKPDEHLSKLRSCEAMGTRDDGYVMADRRLDHYHRRYHHVVAFTASSWPPISNTASRRPDLSTVQQVFTTSYGVQFLPRRIPLHLAADLAPPPVPDNFLLPQRPQSPQNTTVTTNSFASSCDQRPPQSGSSGKSSVVIAIQRVTVCRMTDVNATYSMKMPPKRSRRAVKKVKREGAATEADVDAALQYEDTFEQIFQGYPELSDAASDASHYVGRRRKRSAKSARKQAKPLARRLTFTRASAADTPEADAMSDVEFDSDSEIGTSTSWLGSRLRTSIKSGPKESYNSGASIESGEIATRAEHNRNTLQIQVNSGAENGGSSIAVDLTPLLNGYNVGTTLTVHPNNNNTSASNDNSTLLANSSMATPSLRMQRLSDAKARKQAPQKVKTGFTHLPNELRVRIFRFAFVSVTPISFHSRKDFQRSAALLRTCKLAHEEGRAVLYGENAFHFERSHSSRGRFFEEEWREIGFKDIRRFLETIGATNISLMRYISFDFSDASKSYGPVEEVQRRFVNDPVLWRCLELIGKNTHLSKLSFTLSGRRNLDRSDLHFLRTFSSIKSQEVFHVCSFSGGFRAKPELLADLKKLMLVPRDDPENVNGEKKKKPAVVMLHERVRATKLCGTQWR